MFIYSFLSLVLLGVPIANGEIFYTEKPSVRSVSKASTSCSTSKSSDAVQSTTSFSSSPSATPLSSSVTSTSTLISASYSNTTSLLATTSGTPCLCTAYSQISPAVSACMTVTLSDIHAPASSALILTKLKTGATLIFSGTTTFGFTNSSQFKPILIAGSNVTIMGTKGSVIDGGGERYWDGLGSNGGLPKPGQFMKVQITNHSTMRDLYIKNYPSHGINVAGVLNSTIHHIILNNSMGDAPNSISKGLSAAHNSDGFNVGNSVNLNIHDCKVWNQDDCVVVSDSTNVTVSNMFCSGSHGLSIAGGGTGPGHNITNIVFRDSVVTNSTNGLRIKTDFNATGSVVNVTFANIALSNIKNYGIDIQQDYGNSGSAGIPSNGVRIAGVKFENVRGWAVPKAANYYVLCGDGSCTDFEYKNVRIWGGNKTSSCNYPATGCPS